MEKGILEKMACLCCSVADFLKGLFASRILQGEGVVIDCRMKENVPFGIFSPQAMAFCDKIPQEDTIFLVTIAFKGKDYVVRKGEFFCIGKKVDVMYRKCFCGTSIENIKQARHHLCYY